MMDLAARLREDIAAADDTAAVRRCVAALAQAEALAPGARGVLHSLLARRLLADDPAAALAQLEAAVASRRRAPPACALIDSLCAAARVHERLGRSDAAVRCLAEAVTHDDPLGHCGVQLLHAIAALRRAAGDEAGATASERSMQRRSARATRMGRWHEQYSYGSPEWWRYPNWAFPGPRAAESFHAEDRRRVWLPGCGLTLDPFLFARLGFHVWATELWSAAIDRLRAVEREPAFAAVLDEALAHCDPGGELPRFAAGPGSLRFAVHDSCAAGPVDEFDALYDVKVFQLLDDDERAAAARAYFAALRPGGFALLSTMNVQGASRHALERPLADAGFVVPFIAENREHYAALDATGIDYVEILGRLHARSQQRRDQQRLDALAEQHAARIEAAHATEAARCGDPQARVVNVGYSTG